MKLHLKIEKQAIVGRRAIDEHAGNPFENGRNRSPQRPTIDDSFATFTINGITYQSEPATDQGLAATINRDLAELERAHA